MIKRQSHSTVYVLDQQEALEFYRDTLGMPEELHVESAGGAEVMILDAGRATLEICNTAQDELIDRVEVGRRVSPKFRLALEVTDADGTTARAVGAGAELVAEPTRTPWNSLNSRLETPGGIQLTLFEELGG